MLAHGQDMHDRELCMKIKEVSDELFRQNSKLEGANTSQKRGALYTSTDRLVLREETRLFVYELLCALFA